MDKAPKEIPADEAIILQAMKLVRGFDGNTLIEISCCGITLQRQAAKIEMVKPGLPAMIAEMTLECEATAQKLFESGIIIQPAEMRVALDMLTPPAE